MPSNICPTCGTALEDEVFTVKGDADYYDPEEELAALEARHNALVEALVEAVAWERECRAFKIWDKYLVRATYEWNHVISCARAEVDRLLKEA